MVLFSLAAAFGTAALFGLAPALQTAGTDLTAALKEGGKSSASTRTARLRSLLVIAEVAIALVVLVMAGLVIRSFHCPGAHRSRSSSRATCSPSTSP